MNVNKPLTKYCKDAKPEDTIINLGLRELS